MATVALVVTGVLGLAGIAGTFFAPIYSERVIRRNRERRDLRGATRVVSDELNSAVVDLRLMATLPSVTTSVTRAPLDSSAWDEHKLTLAMAESLSIVDYRRLQIVYARMELLRAWWDGRPLSQNDQEIAADTAAKAEYARNMLIADELRRAGIDPWEGITAWDPVDGIAPSLPT